MTDRPWNDTRSQPAPEGVVLETRLANPDRNMQRMVRKGSLWFFEDMSMYAYYTPSHWRLP